MKKLSKRMNVLKKYINTSMRYSVLDGLKLLQSSSKVKFIESVDVSINLGIDSRKSEQNIRNSVIMPNGIGREVRIAVFAQGDNAVLAKKAGADLVGLEDLFDYIKTKGCKNLDVILASSDVMHVVTKLGSILGPRGLMPNPKVGTVSQNIEESIKNIKLGQVRYKNDKNGIVHATIGKINFSITQLQENLEALIISIKQIKPIQCKEPYIKTIFLSTTMGKSILIDKHSLRVLVY